ncbi:MAG: LLM class flavin-dependent oxidoreductase, partial [Streptomycetaceae bacterium]|nr:LLM class flavin-dependent oxidoreductase [Streptomycetaceae bacterium]
NFHADVFARMGYQEVVDEIGAHFRAGAKDKAAAAVPDELVSDIMIVGTPDHVREQVKHWEAAGVTTLLVGCKTPQEIETLAAVVNAA